MKKWVIKIPGSTANLGPGFDSIGLAINRYLTLEATLADQWFFAYHSPEFDEIPNNEDNLIYKAFKFTADYKDIPSHDAACHVSIDCELPLARGLGSSASAVVAGIELANVLLGLSLSLEEKVRIGSLYEGHPDNIGASIHGGLTVATHLENETVLIPCGKPDLDLAIIVPKHQLLTSTSRNILPNGLPFRDAVKASSIANVLVASLLTKDYQSAGEMMTRDLFHEPYRRAIVPDLEKIQTFVEQNEEVYGAALSGGGPSVIVYLKKDKGQDVAKRLKKEFPQSTIEVLQIEGAGSIVKEECPVE